jgi:prolyl oligopeptidase PreP (S9A serine peptidase family)
VQFQLVIRNTIEAEGDVFGAADVRSLENAVTVGTTPECDVRIEDQELPSESFFRIDYSSATAFLHPLGNESIYINETAVESGATPVLLSGDELRVGHWTFRFQKVRERVGVGHRSNLLSLVTKVLILAIIVGEILLAVWLPQQLKYENMVAVQILEEQCVMMLYQMRHEIDHMETLDPQADELEKLRAAAIQIVREQLDGMATYIRKSQTEMTPEHWTQLRNELDRLQSLLYRIHAGTVFKPLPELEMDNAIRNAINGPLG